MLLKNSCCFYSIVVVKNKYNNGQTNREAAFYQTYTLLVKNTARQLKRQLEVIIDQKVDMRDSKDHLGLQAVDILTGAVNSGYLKYLNPNLKLSTAKEIAFERMSSLLGWNIFQYDTYPNKDFNIWHVPPEICAWHKDYQSELRRTFSHTKRSVMTVKRIIKKPQRKF